MGPLFTAILSYFILKERLKLIDIAVLITSFAGILLLIFGAQQKEIDDEQTSSSLAMILFFSIPVLQAINNVNMRTLRVLNDFTIGVYLQITMITVYTPFVYLFQDGLSVISVFDKHIWTILIITGIISVSLSISRKKAINYGEPGKLTGLNFFQSVFQLIIDVLVFHT